MRPWNPPPPPPRRSRATFTADDSDLCRSMGISVEDYSTEGSLRAERDSAIEIASRLMNRLDVLTTERNIWRRDTVVLAVILVALIAVCGVRFLC